MSASDERRHPSGWATVGRHHQHHANQLQHHQNQLRDHSQQQHHQFPHVATGRRPRQLTISGGLDVSLAQLGLARSDRLVHQHQHHHSASAINQLNQPNHLSLNLNNLSQQQPHHSRQPVVAASISGHKEPYHRQYSSSQAQLQSLESAGMEPIEHTKMTQRAKTPNLAQHHHHHHRSQLSLSGGNQQPMNDPASRGQQQQQLAPVQTASIATQTAAPLPPPYSVVVAASSAAAAAGGDTANGGHGFHPSAICQQPQPAVVGGQHPAQYSSNCQPAPINPAARGSSSSFPSQQQQPPASSSQQLNFQPATSRTGVGANCGVATSATPFNQFSPYLQHHPSQANNDTVACQQQQQQQFHPHHLPSMAGVTTKSKSCLTCADISIKWYIVVIALLGLICALIGTIVGAVHSAGRDYISLALLLTGVGLVLVAISWVALRITLKTYRRASGGSESATNAAPTTTALTASMASPIPSAVRCGPHNPQHQRRPPPPPPPPAQGSSRHPTPRPLGPTPSSHQRNLLNERLYMVAAAAAALSRAGPRHHHQAPAANEAGLVGGIKRLARGIRARTTLGEAPPPAPPPLDPALAGPALAAFLHHYHQHHHQHQQHPHPAFLFAPPPPPPPHLHPHLFPGFPVGDGTPIRPPPPSYSASMQDQRLRQLMQERAGIRAASAAASSAAAPTMQQQPPPQPPRPSASTSDGGGPVASLGRQPQQVERAEPASGNSGNNNKLKSSSSSPTLTANDIYVSSPPAQGESAASTTSVISIRSGASPAADSLASQQQQQQPGQAKLLGRL